jgi:pyridoxamine 5'-phosphate oxidase
VNPNASITILWKELERQICVRGKVEKTSRQTSEDYFKIRPYNSQIGAWVSECQSEPILDRSTIASRQNQFEMKFPKGTEVPCPEFWGGYNLRPNYIEFWQGRQGRLHDRLCFF